MAATLSGEATVLGNKRAYVGTITTDAVTATAAIPGIKKIDCAVLTPVSGATAVYSVHYNLGAAGAEVMGSLNITTCGSGDVYSVLVFGN